MKLNYINEKKTLTECFASLPIVSHCEVFHEDDDGFDFFVQLNDGSSWKFHIFILKKAYPKEIDRLVNRLGGQQGRSYTILMAPYVSDKSAELCEKYGLGFVDASGNVRIIYRSLCIIKSGNPNKKPEVRDGMNLFNPLAVTSSMIMRKLLEEPNKPWKLKYLSEEVGCSIGMVSRVKDELCNQMWAEMTKNGLRIIDSEAILRAWSKKYSLPEQTGCYTLDSLSVFEGRLHNLEENYGIQTYLTGFSGGVRYAPAVRYNRVHVFVQPEKMDEFVELSGCKRVDSGANVILLPAREDYIYGADRKNGDYVVSPVQAYLDCMQLKGRGEELAESILLKEIGNDS